MIINFDVIKKDTERYAVKPFRGLGNSHTGELTNIYSPKKYDG